MGTFKTNLRVFFSNKLGVIGVICLVMFICLAIFADDLAPYDPYERVGRPFQAPSGEHWLGTNDVGHDILSEVIVGTRISLLIGVSSAFVAIVIGTLIGLSSGYFGGYIDAILMRIVDVFLTVPMLPIMILIAVFLGPSFWNIIIVIGVLSWASTARVIRSQVLTVKNRGYIEAVNVLGGKPFYTIFRHILPPTFSIIISELIIVSSRAVLLESSLSFLGLGDPTQKSWGIIVYYAQARSAFLTNAWLWWILPPGILVTLLVVSFSYVGNALEQVVNPRLRRK